MKRLSGHNSAVQENSGQFIKGDSSGVSCNGCGTEMQMGGIADGVPDPKRVYVRCPSCRLGGWMFVDTEQIFQDRVVRAVKNAARRGAFTGLLGLFEDGHE